MGIDATDLFDRYEEEYEDMSGSGFPQIEINKMHISQSIEVRGTDAFSSAGGPGLTRHNAPSSWAGRVCSGFFSSLFMKGCNKPLKRAPVTALLLLCQHVSLIGWWRGWVLSLASKVSGLSSQEVRMV